MQTIILQKLPHAHFLAIPNLSYIELVMLMQVTKKIIPELSQSIRDYINTTLGGKLDEEKS